MKKLIKKEIQSTLNELKNELQNSTIEEQKAFNNAILFIGIIFLLSIFIL